MTIDNPLPEPSRSQGWLSAVGLGVIEMVPLVGGLASNLISEGMTQAAREQDLNYLAMLSARVSSLEQAGSPVDPTHPEFVAAVRLTLAASGRTADEEKRQLLARAASNSGPWSSTAANLREEFRSLTADMSAVYVAALAAVARDLSLHDPATGAGISRTFDQFVELVGGDRLFAQRALLQLQQVGIFGMPIHPAFAPTIELSEYGRAYLNFLREPGPPL